MQAGDVEPGVHEQAAIGLQVEYATQGQAGEGAAVVALQCQLQVGYGKVQRVVVALMAVGVAHVLGAQHVAGIGVGVGPAHLGGAVGTQRKREVDGLVGRTCVRDGQRLRWRLVMRNVEQRAVGHDAPGADDGYLAEGEEFLVQLQLGEAIPVPTAVACVDVVFQVPGGLLEVLGLDEEALAPDDGVAGGHRLVLG